MAASMDMPNGGGAASAPSSTMKLLIDTASEHVLFGEAGKDVVDFILGLLAMPLGAVWHLLRDGDAADALGSIANIYASVEKMDTTHMKRAETRDALVVNDTSPVSPSLRLLPATTTSAFSHMPPACLWHPLSMAGIQMAPLHPMHLPQPAPPPPLPLWPRARDGGIALALLPPPLYRCHDCVALGSLQSSEGFVQGVANYTVMDDLTVTPASNLSTVAQLGRLGVKDLAANLSTKGSLLLERVYARDGERAGQQPGVGDDGRGHGHDSEVVHHHVRRAAAHEPASNALATSAPRASEATTGRGPRTARRRPAAISRPQDG